MTISVIGIDIAKRIFQPYGVDDHGRTVLRKRLTRATFLMEMAAHPRCVVGMEAGSGAHHWGSLPYGDGYARFENLYRSGTIREVACMAHVRRKFVDIRRSQGSPIAEEAIGRVAQLYAVEKEARGSPPDRRAELRSTHSPRSSTIWNDGWPCNSPRSPLAVVIRYALTRMERMRPYLDHGILELDMRTALACDERLDNQVAAPIPSFSRPRQRTRCRGRR